MDRRRPFTRADALAAGISPEVLRGARFRLIFRGVYVDASVPMTPALRIEAALLPFTTTAHACHVSAARLYGVPVPAIAEAHITVREPRERRRRDGIRVHVARQERVRLVGGIRASDFR